MTLRPRDWYTFIITLTQKIVRYMKTKHRFLAEKSIEL